MMEKTDLLNSIHNSVISFNKRAERSSSDVLVETFVDSEPFYSLLSTTNSQVIYGRRGTGKTHALKYLESQGRGDEDFSIYIDFRTIGSNSSIYNDARRPLAERASYLIGDVLAELNDRFLQIAVQRLDQRCGNSTQISLRLDDFSKIISQVKVTGDVEIKQEKEKDGTGVSGLSVGGGACGTDARIEFQQHQKNRESEILVRSGAEVPHLEFSGLNTSLAGLLKVLGISRLWLLLDEWSEVPIQLQPYLADLVRRVFLPISELVVKIAAIEHRTSFIKKGDRGQYIGIELGADMSADLNLDDFLVFDNNQEKATQFFKDLLFRHYKQAEESSPNIKTAEDFIAALFTQQPAFVEFVRAVEGVPRDALNLAAKISTQAYGQRIAIEHIRKAARAWYTDDKAATIKNSPYLQELLTKIIDEVIGKRKSRAFLFKTNQQHHLIEELFDARILHILKKNVSAKDEPGIRYDVFKIDYGCYVDLINTSQAPNRLFEVEDDESSDVPKDDYRSIRRAILRLEDVEKVYESV